MSGQSGEEQRAEEKRQLLLQYLFYTVGVVILGYVLLYVV